IWDWWGESVHFCPQADKSGRGRMLNFRPPYVNDLLENALPQDRNRGAAEPTPGRTVNMDANLGHALFQLCADLHWHLLGCAPDWNQYRGSDKSVRPCQSCWVCNGKPFVCFAPGKGYFQAYCNRIRADGWKHFPEYTRMRGIDLTNEELRVCSFQGSD